MDPPESFCSSLNCKFHVILQNDQFRVRMFQPCRNNLPESTPMTNQMPQKHPAIIPVKAVLQFFRYNVPTTDILVFFYLLKLHVQEVFLIFLLRILAAAEPQNGNLFSPRIFKYSSRYVSTTLWIKTDKRNSASSCIRQPICVFLYNFTEFFSESL